MELKRTAETESTAGVGSGEHERMQEKILWFPRTGGGRSEDQAPADGVIRSRITAALSAGGGLLFKQVNTDRIPRAEALCFPLKHLLKPRSPFSLQNVCVCVSHSVTSNSLQPHGPVACQAPLSMG